MKRMTGMTSIILGLIIIGCASVIGGILIHEGRNKLSTEKRDQIIEVLDSVQNIAIEKINTTTDTTISKIISSSNSIILELENKTTSLGKALDNLEKQTELQTKSIKENTNFKSKETQDVVTFEAENTRTEIKTSKDETIDAVLSIDPNVTGLTYILNNLNKLIKDNNHLNWESWKTTGKQSAEIFIKRELNNLSDTDKSALISFLITTKLIGSQEDLGRESRKHKGDKEKVEYRSYWPYVPVNLAYMDFSNTIFNETISAVGLFFSYGNFQDIEISSRFTLTRCFFSSANFSGSKMSNAEFLTCTMPSTKWANCKLKNAKFNGTDLTFSSWSYWRLGKPRGIIYQKTLADLSDVDFSNANLTNALISNEQLMQAKSLKNATMPTGKKYDPEISIEKQNLKYQLIE